MSTPRFDPRSQAGLQRQILSVCILAIACWLGFSGPRVETVTHPNSLLILDPNHVPLPVLGALPGIGQARMKAIDLARKERPFASADDLDRRVKGIGPATIAELKPFLRFDTKSP